MERAIAQPMPAIAIRTTAATPTRPSQYWWTTALTSGVSSVRRTAPKTSPPEATGTATYKSPVCSVSEWRVPSERTPARAERTSGRLEKSRPGRPAVSSTDVPALSTTTTRMPVRWA